MSLLGKQNKNRYPNNTRNEETGFVASLENLSDDLLQLVTEDNQKNYQDDQLQ